jgi:cyclopropane-fatty-acyl-phospholipid synthase
MSLVAAATAAVERLPLPDAVTRFGISTLVGRTRRRLAEDPGTDDKAFAAA